MSARRRGGRARGFSLMDVVCAMAVIATVAGAGTAVSLGHFRFVARCHEETVAGRAASSHLERLGASREPFAEGTQPFALDADAAQSLPAAAATRTLAQVEPGLWNVRVNVAWHAADGGRGRVELTTLLAREVPR